MQISKLNWILDSINRKLLPVRIQDLLFLPFMFLALSPYLGNGYYFDDGTHHSFLPSVLHDSGQTYWSYLSQIVQSWANNAGRLFPVRILVSTLPIYLIDDLKTFRGLHVFAVALNVILVMAIIREISGSKAWGYFFGAYIFLFFQNRNYHDPISSYGFLMQVSFFLSLGSQYLFWKHLQSGSRLLLGLSVSLYTLAILDYEPMLSGILVMSGLTHLHRRKGNAVQWSVLWPFVVVTAVYVGVWLYLRSRASMPYLGTSFGKPGLVPKAYLIQFLAAFPFSFLIGSKGIPLGYWEQVRSDFSLWPSLVLAPLVASISYFSILRKLGENEDRNTDVLLLLAGSRILLPPLFVAISARYQLELRPGLAYLPVYSAYFGLAGLTGYFILRSFKREFSRIQDLDRMRRKALAFSLVLGILVGITHSANQAVSMILDTYWKGPRNLVVRAIERGLLNSIEPDATIIVAQPHPWLKSELLHTFRAETKVENVHEMRPERMTELMAQDLSGKNIYFMNFTTRPNGLRWVALGRVTQVLRVGPDPRSLEFLTLNPFVFTEFPPGSTLGSTKIQTWRYSEPSNTPSTPERMSVRILDLPLVELGSNWMLSRIPTSSMGTQTGISLSSGALRFADFPQQGS